MHDRTAKETKEEVGEIIDECSGFYIKFESFEDRYDFCNQFEEQFDLPCDATGSQIFYFTKFSHEIENFIKVYPVEKKYRYQMYPGLGLYNRINQNRFNQALFNTGLSLGSSSGCG